jgi:hypothetical protein
VVEFAGYVRTSHYRLLATRSNRLDSGLAPSVSGHRSRVPGSQEVDFPALAARETVGGGPTYLKALLGADSLWQSREYWETQINSRVCSRKGGRQWQLTMSARYSSALPTWI